MERVQHLASGIDPHAQRDRLKNTQNMPQNQKRPAQESINDASLLPSCSKIRKQVGQDVVPSTSGQFDDVRNQKVFVGKELPEPLKLLISKLPPQSSIQHSNAIEVFYICASKAKVHPDFVFTERKDSVIEDEFKRGKRKTVKKPSVWRCRLYIGDLLLSSAENASKNEAKRDCIASAIAMLFHPGLYIKDVNCPSVNGRKHTSELVVDAMKPFDTEEVEQIQNQTLKSANLRAHMKSPNNIGRFGNFILVESSSFPNPLNTLISSASRNKVDMVFDISDTHVKYNDEIGYLGKLILCGKVIAHAVNEDKKSVKRTVAIEAVKELKTTCYTIKTKFHEHQSAQNNAISMESIKTDEQNSTKITSGIGMQLLKKMGWSGEGGLGKKGQGIAEPVLVEERGYREGFGAAVATPKDTNALQEMVKNFAVSNRDDDLVFSSDLSSEQRKVLHTTCRKYHLKSTSYGKDNDRYLLISRKRNIHQLAEYIAKNGGDTAQYTLVPPQGNSPSD